MNIIERLEGEREKALEKLERELDTEMARVEKHFNKMIEHAAELNQHYGTATTSKRAASPAESKNYRLVKKKAEELGQFGTTDLVNELVKEGKKLSRTTAYRYLNEMHTKGLVEKAGHGEWEMSA